MENPNTQVGAFEAVVNSGLDTSSITALPQKTQVQASYRHGLPILEAQDLTGAGSTEIEEV